MDWIKPRTLIPVPRCPAKTEGKDQAQQSSALTVYHPADPHGKCQVRVDGDMSGCQYGLPAA
jgi:hypothetical protein